MCKKSKSMWSWSWSRCWSAWVSDADSCCIGEDEESSNSVAGWCLSIRAFGGGKLFLARLPRVTRFTPDNITFMYSSDDVRTPQYMRPILISTVSSHPSKCRNSEARFFSARGVFFDATDDDMVGLIIIMWEKGNGRVIAVLLIVYQVNGTVIWHLVHTGSVPLSTLFTCTLKWPLLFVPVFARRAAKNSHATIVRKRLREARFAKSTKMINERELHILKPSKIFPDALLQRTAIGIEIIRVVFHISLKSSLPQIPEQWRRRTHLKLKEVRSTERVKESHIF